MAKQRMKDNHLGECAYCPAPATTKDHIPPQGMFAEGMPSKPWVPACLACNREASLDDEYIQRLSMLWGADDCKDAIDAMVRDGRRGGTAVAVGRIGNVLAAYAGSFALDRGGTSGYFFTCSGFMLVVLLALARIKRHVAPAVSRP